MRLALLILTASLSWGACSTDSNGWCITGLSAIQNNLLGPLIPFGASPWVFGDAAEKAVVDNMAPIALTGAPVLGTVLPGTVSWSGGNTITTTSDWTGLVAANDFIVIAWDTVDGAGTGRQVQQVSGLTATTVTFYTNNFVPASSGITAYKMSSTPDAHGCTFLCWTNGNPATVWNYYDVAIGLYRLYYRTGDATYQTQARQYADIQWQWVIDHGYTYPYPRAAAMISQFFRALDGHSERFSGLYTEVTKLVASFGNPAGSPNIDNRESGYTLWDVALGAKTDSDATRHAQYCSWLSTYTATWNSVQSADGSWGENEYGLNPSFVSAPKAFSAPFVYQGAPWRQAINVRSLEAAYESLNDTTSQGCNNPSLAATTLTTITKAVTWQNNYGRDSVNRGIYYEVNSQSNDQLTVYPGVGTVSVSLSSTALVGVGTDFLAKCAADPFIGINSSRTIYKLASCANDTHATLSVAYGLYGESGAASGSAVAYAPASVSVCHSSATYCYDGNGDRNLTRTVCGGEAWLYAQTLNATYKTWSDECVSATLGGPTAGLTSAATIGVVTLPCSGSACDGLVTDVVASAKNCTDTSNVPPCVFGSSIDANLGKNFGEAFGALGIDNALAWRLLGGAAPLTCAPATGATTPNIKDIQLQTNMALGVSSCTNNLKQSGNCNIVDIQRVVSAALGLACKIGP